jgi:4'-phosphopantetheinyl transferase
MPTRPTTHDQSDPSVVVWWAHRSLAAALDDAVLSDAERKRVTRLRGAADRERSAVARGILRLALASVLPDRPADLVIDWEHGPVLPGSLETWASVSHSDDAVAIAVSTAGPIGVDVESMRRTTNLAPAVQEAVFTKDERAQLSAIAVPDRRAAALRLWTLKEAVLKSTGDGLVRAPSTLAVADLAGLPWLSRFDDRDDLVGGTQLFTLTPVVEPYVIDDPDATGAPSAIDTPGEYIASLALLTADAVSIEQRDATELLALR